MYKINNSGVLISGFKESGKDTFTDLVVGKLREMGIDSKNYQLARKLKLHCAEVSGLSIDYMYDQNLKEVILDKEIFFGQKEIEHIFNCFCLDHNQNHFDKMINRTFPSARKLMQFIGTEVLRYADENIHCKFLLEEIKTEGKDFYFISDHRFKSEKNYIKTDAFFIVRDSKTPKKTPDLHESELGMFDLKEEYQNITNNESLERLEEKAFDFAQSVQNYLKK